MTNIHLGENVYFNSFQYNSYNVLQTMFNYFPVFMRMIYSKICFSCYSCCCWCCCCCSNRNPTCISDQNSGYDHHKEQCQLHRFSRPNNGWRWASDLSYPPTGWDTTWYMMIYLGIQVCTSNIMCMYQMNCLIMKIEGYGYQPTQRWVTICIFKWCLINQCPACVIEMLNYAF